MVLSALSAMLSPFSSVPLVPSAIAVWGTGLTLVFLIGGWLLGGGVAYVIGKWFGYPVVTALISPKTVDRWIGEVESKLHFLLILLFRIATPSETGYIFGIMRYNFGKYLLATLISELPYGLVIVYAGQAFLARETELFLFLGVTSGVVILACYFLFRREFKL